MPNYSYFNPGTPNPVYIDPMIGVDAFTKNRQNALLMKQRAEELVYERGRDTRADERNAAADKLAQEKAKRDADDAKRKDAEAAQIKLSNAGTNMARVLPGMSPEYILGGGLDTDHPDVDPNMRKMLKAAAKNPVVFEKIKNTVYGGFLKYEQKQTKHDIQQLIDLRDNPNTKPEDKKLYTSILQNKVKDTGTDKTFEEKIKKLSSEYGISEKDATGLILGTTTVYSDPVAGGRFLVDKITGTERPLTTSKASETVTVKAKAPIRTIWDMAEKGTGPWSDILSKGSVVSGAVGGPVARETIQARQSLRSSSAEFARAVKNNPRYAEGERKWILDEMGLLPTFFDNPKMLKERAIAIGDYLERRLDNERRAANDNTLPVAEQQAARSSVMEITNFLEVLGIPPKINNDEEYEALKLKLKSGDEFIDPTGKVRRMP